MPTPNDRKLYERVKKAASAKFVSKSGIYRSSWIVREYKKRGGTYSGSKPKNSGLKRWYKEKWVDLNRPSGKKSGFKQCGRTKMNSKGKYPLCRPTKRISPKTPVTYGELSKKSISKAKKDKAKIRGRGNIKFSSQRKSLRKSPRKKHNASVPIEENSMCVCF